MKANELRIGNLVKRESQPDGFYIDSQSFLKVELHPNWYEPIPLTEEWLVKFGFNKQDGENYCEFHEEFEFVYKYYGYGICIYWNNEAKRFLDDQLEEYKCELINVHQLQNLVFALTGEELTIK